MKELKKLICINIVFTLSVIFADSLQAQNATPKRYVCQGIGNLDSGVNHAIPVMNKMVAAGCNAAFLTVWWDRVYPQVNSKPNFAQLDNQINHAINNLGIKVAIRIHLGRTFSLTKGFWEEEESVKDFKGKPLTHYYDNNHFSFAHQPSIEKAKSFVKEVCERYKNYQKAGKIIFITVVNTPQQELGYAFQNQQWPEREYQAVFDHSKWSMIKWKDWAKEKYTTIRTLNSYWGTSYKNFTEVEPYVNWGTPQDSFRGRRGKDWYVFRHLLLKNYYDQIIESIKSVEPTYKVACEFGGVADDLTILRATFGFKNLSEKADIVKTSSEGFQGDIAFSNLAPNQKFYTEVAFFDLQTADDLKKYVQRTVEYGCEFIMLGVESDNPADFEKILPAVQEAVKAIDKVSPAVVFADSVTYRLSQLTDSRELVINDWKTKSDNGKKRIKVILEEDLIIENKKIENPLPDIVETTPTTPTPPPTPPTPSNPNLPNQLPKENIKDYTKELVVNQSFQFRIPENLYYDTDGFIAFIEVLESPSWVNFNRFELNFYGKAPYLGKNKVKLRVYDNSGGSIESNIYLEIVPPIIDFELIKADYFNVPIQGLGLIYNKNTLYLDHLPEQVNFVARCNLDSVNFIFNLTGPYKFSRSSDRIPYNLFGEGRGLKFPVGTYTLSAKAYKNDSVITSKTIQFFVSASTNPAENILPDWRIYPNPFEQICNIKLPDSEDLTLLNFALFTSTGQKQAIKKDFITIVEKTAYIDLGHVDIPAGNYILEVNKNGEVLKRVRVSKL
ncbi:beta-galactosidase [Emticicia sp. SJ17W-69]|uniref:beta-galactosidase n=1 Tax=Emticicia sp. SJ17W-69 TaxID=3421657 RepID=UPI003EBBE3E1